MEEREKIERTKRKRNIVYLTLSFCALIILLLIFRTDSTELTETAMTWAWITGAATVSSFVFGEAYEFTKRLK